LVFDRLCCFNLKKRDDGRGRGVMIVCTNKKGKVVWDNRERDKGMKGIKMTRR
jgi:hypothetical protein